MKFTPLAGIETPGGRNYRDTGKMKFTPLAGIETVFISSFSMGVMQMKFTPLAGIETRYGGGFCQRKY